jgi:hypothetical protein
MVKEARTRIKFLLSQRKTSGKGLTTLWTKDTMTKTKQEKTKNTHLLYEHLNTGSGTINSNMYDGDFYITCSTLTSLAPYNVYRQV